MSLKRKWENQPQGRGFGWKGWERKGKGVNGRKGGRGRVGKGWEMKRKRGEWEKGRERKGWERKRKGMNGRREIGRYGEIRGERGKYREEN